MRKKMKTPRRKRVENREEAYEIMVEDGKGDQHQVTRRLRLLANLDSQRFLLLLDMSPNNAGTDNSPGRIRQ